MVNTPKRLEVNNFLFSNLNPLSAKGLARMQVDRKKQRGNR